jgi:dihydroorotate dehydrogenase (fumarate)
MRLAHPFIAGASPLSHTVDSVKRLEDAGCAAVVLHSLFEEQITREYSGRVAQVNVFESDFADVLAAFPSPLDYPYGPDEYAEHVHRVKQAVSIPVIASMNGRTAESWLKFAHVIEQAGADALELNMYQLDAEPGVSGEAVESQLEAAIADLKPLLRIPVSMKLSPYFTALGNVVRRLERRGVDGVVLFNRFYQPDLDIDTMRVVPRVELSTSAELLLRLRWTAILFGRVRPSLAISGGVATPADGIKSILAGADVVQMVSALLRHGPEYVAIMRRELERWLETHHMTALGDARGAASLKATSDAASYERANYIRTLHSWAS